MLVPSRAYSGHLALEPLRLVGVAPAQRLQLRCEPGLGRLSAQCAEAERHDQQADSDGEQDDPDGRGQPAEHWGEDTGESENKVVRPVYRDAEKSGHEETAFQLG
jgi:hypothetical protein